MNAVPRRALRASVVVWGLGVVWAWGVAPAFADEHGRVRLEDSPRSSLAADARGLAAAPLPPGPDFSAPTGLRAVRAYGPEQRIRLKQMNFTGVQ
ncbi:hypothetical protein SAMN06265338_10928 [Rhodoblastus acidophilus]|uniref:Uncharacterized protein n=1 Tax=Rhodoblastus acidophilus TaxID=1074 RepID=A0A212RZ85_RHOAC|nr:hypothetical protein [Rhodoblastus acidophilus]SNB77980.1 hypothetical protein SAMN06265338_10928 [Rhodoblastus acidophilus]